MNDDRDKTERKEMKRVTSMSQEARCKQSFVWGRHILTLFVFLCGQESYSVWYKNVEISDDE